MHNWNSQRVMNVECYLSSEPYSRGRPSYDEAGGSVFKRLGGNKASGGRGGVFNRLSGMGSKAGGSGGGGGGSSWHKVTVSL